MPGTSSEARGSHDTRRDVELRGMISGAERAGGTAGDRERTKGEGGGV